jgi:CheY-like chemotaxis protein
MRRFRPALFTGTNVLFRDRLPVFIVAPREFERNQLTTEPISVLPVKNAPAPESWQAPWKILIADDHELIRKGARAALEGRGQTQVWEAENGKEAVEKASALKPHLVILDISMPLLDGFSAAREIRKLSPDTKILIVSFNRTEAFIEVARKIGVWGYVLKSDGTRAFLQAVSDALDTVTPDPAPDPENSFSDVAEPR